MRETAEVMARFEQLKLASRGEPDNAITARALACAQDIPPMCQRVDALEAELAAVKLALARAVEERDDLRRRVNGVLSILANVGLSPTPGATGAILTSVRLTLESSHDRQEAQP